MKSVLFIIGGVVFVLVMILITVFFLENPSATVLPSSEIDYKFYVCAVSKESPGGNEKLGYACVSTEKNNMLLLLTAAHVVANPQDNYIVTFCTGNSKKIKSITIPDGHADIAFLEVDKENLNLNSDYSIPSFIEDEKSIHGKKVYLFGDEYSDFAGKTVVQTQKKSSTLVTHLTGKIEKGRSGTPVFVEKTKNCIGVVSGYFEQNGNTDCQTVCLLVK